MKNFGLVLVVVLCVAGVAGVVVYYKNQINDISKTLETERYSRLVAEEKVVNSVSKIQQLQDELADNQSKIDKIQGLLKEEKNINKDLDSQFQKLSKAKSQLEEQIQTLISQQAVAAQAAAAVQEVVDRDKPVESNVAVAPKQ